jgi:predicted permease
MPAFPNYLDTFQTVLVQFLFAVLGYLFNLTGFFNPEEAIGFLQIIRLVSLPAVVFTELSVAPLKWSTFRPFVHSLLTQVTIHVGSLAAAYAIPAVDRLTQFFTFVYSYSHTCFIPYGYPMVRNLFGTEFLFLPVVVNTIETLLLRPLHTWASFHMSLLAASHTFVPESRRSSRMSRASAAESPEVKQVGPD